jgi:hypothetical protein
MTTTAAASMTARTRREQLESAVWPVLVVVAAVDAEHMLEMAAAEDEDPVEAVGANRAYPTLGEGRLVGSERSRTPR